MRDPLDSPCGRLSSVPHSSNLGVPHLPLQLENTIHQRLRSRRAARHINIDRHDTVAATHDAVAVVVVAAAVGAGAHGDDPAGLGHLVVDLAEGGSHLVGEGAGYDHDVGLAGGGSEDDAQAILVVAGGGEVHHFDGAAGEAEGHGPEGGLAGPVGDDVEGCPTHVSYQLIQHAALAIASSRTLCLRSGVERSEEN